MAEATRVCESCKEACARACEDERDGYKERRAAYYARGGGINDPLPIAFHERIEAVVELAKRIRSLPSPSPGAPAPKCECDQHDTPCSKTADYPVTRAGKRIAVCDRCTLPGDGTDDRDLNPDWSLHHASGTVACGSMGGIYGVNDKPCPDCRGCSPRPTTGGPDST